MEWDAYLVFKTAGIAVFVFAGGLSVSRNLSVSRPKAYFINAVAVFAGFALSRIWYIAQHFFGRELYDVRTLSEAWSDAGSVLYGWVLGGTFAIIVLTRFFKIPTVKYLDRVLPWLLIAQVLNRLGCFDAGCCFGSLTACPISVESYELSGMVHPVQLYEAIFDLALFWAIKKRPYRLGLPTWMYFIGYPAGRFFLEFLRGDNQPALLFMTVPQVTSILILIVVVSFKNKILRNS